MEHLSLYKSAQSSRIPALGDLVLSPKSSSMSYTSRSLITIRCQELRHLIDLYNSTLEKYQSLMFRMPSNTFPSDFPKSFSDFRDSFETFIKTIEPYISEAPTNDVGEKKIIKIINLASTLNEKLSAFLRTSTVFSNTGMDELTKSVECSFQTLFKVNNSLSIAIKQDTTGNKDLIAKETNLCRDTYKTYKLIKSILEENEKAEILDSDAEKLKKLVSSINADGSYLLNSNIIEKSSNRTILMDFRRTYSTTCGFIQSLIDVLLIFNESISQIKFNLLALAKMFNNVIYQCKLPCKIDMENKLSSTM